MSKILSARDLLDLVRQREEEERQETETVDSGRAQGRRIYPGTTRRARPRRPEPQPARPRPRNNTQLLEQPARQTGAPQRPPDRSRLPPAERGRDEQLDPPTPLMGVPTPIAALGSTPAPMTPAMRRQPTVQMPKGKGAKAEPKPPAPAAPPPPPPADEPDVEGMSPTLEIEVPQEMREALELPKPSSPAPAAAPAEKPTRKTSAQSWVRAQSDGATSQPPASPPRQPSLAAKPARSITPPVTPAAAPPQPVAEAASPEVAPSSDPSPGSPGKSAVASMFSWVTQKPDWAPPSKSLAASVPPPSPVAPPSAPPPTIPMAEPVPESARSLVANEPIALTSEETLVLINYDATAPLEEMAERTGLSEWRVEKIVETLKTRGVLDEEAESEPGSDLAARAPEPPKPPEPPKIPKPPEPPKIPKPPEPPKIPEPPPPPAPPIDVLAPPPSSGRPVLALEPEHDEPAPRDRERTLLELELEAFVSDDDSKLKSHTPPLERAKTEELEAAPDTEAPDTETTIVDDGSGVPESEAKATKRPDVKPEESTVQAQASQDDQAGAEDDTEPRDDAPGDEDVVGGQEGNEGFSVKTLLAYYENVLALLPLDERAKIATTGSGKELYALCFDKDPQVIRPLWQNVNISNEHARFAAFHHRTAVGLEIIGQRNEFLRDPQVQRRFIRNPMVSETLLRKMLLSKRLLEIYKVTLDRDASDRTRQSSRALLRNKFAVTDPEDRLELIWRTEGRALTALSGLSIDSKTAALICARPLVSLMLVQQFCRFAATPPSVIHHFLKQNIVKRQVHLRNALLKHPNCPSDAKRAF